MLTASNLAAVVLERFCSEANSEQFIEELARRIEFHASYLRENGLQELAAVFFIECSAEAVNDGLSFQDLTRILSKVQKRAYRASKPTASQSIENAELAADRNASHRQDLEELIGDAKRLLSYEESLLFSLYFVNECTIESIASTLGTSTSTVYRKIVAIRGKLVAGLDPPGSR